MYNLHQETVCPEGNLNIIKLAIHGRQLHVTCVLSLTCLICHNSWEKHT